MSRSEIRDIDDLVCRLDTIVTGDLHHRQDCNLRKESQNSKQLKKGNNLASWFQSDFSILDSQPQTTKITADGTNQSDREKLERALRSKRRSISETRIAEFKSPDLDQRKMDYLKVHQALTSTAVTKPKDGGLEPKKKKNKRQFQTEASGPKPANTTRVRRRVRSRESSLKFLTDRTQNVFGEKMSMQLASLKKSVLNAIKEGKPTGKEKPGLSTKKIVGAPA